MDKLFLKKFYKIRKMLPKILELCDLLGWFICSAAIYFLCYFIFLVTQNLLLPVFISMPFFIIGILFILSSVFDLLLKKYNIYWWKTNGYTIVERECTENDIVRLPLSTIKFLLDNNSNFLSVENIQIRDENIDWYNTYENVIILKTKENVKFKYNNVYGEKYISNKLNNFSDFKIVALSWADYIDFMSLWVNKEREKEQIKKAKEKARQEEALKKKMEQDKKVEIQNLELATSIIKKEKERISKEYQTKIDDLMNDIQTADTSENIEVASEIADSEISLTMGNE